MKTKIISLLLLLTMLLSAVALTGCGKKNTLGDFQVPEGGYDGSEVTISFYHTMGSNLSDVLNLYIAKFNEIYPNIHIEAQQVGSYDDVRKQISTEIPTGAYPNIAYCYPDHVALYNLAKVVVTLDDLIASQESDGNNGILGLTDAQKADFIEGYYNEGKQFGDGKMYTMPFSKSTEVLYYNKTFFEANNLTPPTTWDEMEALCARIKEIDPSSIPLGYDSESNWFITMCEQYGSPYTSATDPHFQFDNETNRNFVERFRNWYQLGYVTTSEIYGTYTSGLFTVTAADQTKSYMSIGSSAGATHQRPEKVDGVYPFDVGITTIPQVDPSKPKAISQGPSVCIFNKANAQEVVASWLFVKYLTTNVEFQAMFSDASGYVPVLKSVENHPFYTAKLASADGGDNIAYLSAQVCMRQADAYYTSPAFNGSSKARDQVGNLFVQCMTAKAEEIPNGDLKAYIQKAFSDAVANCGG